MPSCKTGIRWRLARCTLQLRMQLLLGAHAATKWIHTKPYLTQQIITDAESNLERMQELQEAKAGSP